MTKNFKYVFALVLVLLMLLGAISTVFAQSSTITPNTWVQGQLTDTSTLSIYTLAVSSGDFIEINLISINPQADLNVSLLSPSSAPVAGGVQNQQGIDQLNFRATETGVHTILLGSANNVFGSYLVKVDVSNNIYQDLPTNLGPIQINVDNKTFSVAFAIAASQCQTVVVVENQTDNFYFDVTLSDGNGATIATTSNGLAGVAYALSPNQAGFILEIYSQRIQTGSLTVEVANDCAQSSGDQPTQTGESTAPIGVCSVNSTLDVNIRTGPGTVYYAIGGLYPGNFLEVVGQANGWYQVEYNNGLGWVSGTVVTTNGDCTNVPYVTPPPTPYPTATSTPTATTTPTATNTSEATYTPSWTPTGATSTPSNTPTWTPTITPSYTPTWTPTPTPV